MWMSTAMRILVDILSRTIRNPREKEFVAKLVCEVKRTAIFVESERQPIFGKTVDEDMHQ